MMPTNKMETQMENKEIFEEAKNPKAESGFGEEVPKEEKKAETAKEQKKSKSKTKELEAALEEGMERGMKKGLAEGEARGREEGKAEGKAEAVRKMLAAGMDIEQICSIMEMSREEVERME
jgi:predicted transposase/invertase (TIGR01784 family)